jgi:choline-sulfatase
VPSWHHRLKAAGREVVSIGKLHFRSADDGNGFTEEVMPMHVVDGVGDPLSWLRDPLPVRSAALRLAKEAGRGNSKYQEYDDKITDTAVAWLKARAARADADGRPFVLFVSIVCPHFPLIARPEWYDLYPEDAVPLPALYAPEERPSHPYVAAIRECQVYDKAFDATSLRRAIAAYFGMVSFTDHNVGRLVAALGETGLAENTRVLYASDHGDNLGTRGLWGKSTMYEEAAGIPMIAAGPGLPEGAVCAEPVSLADAFPTILDWTGVAPNPDDSDVPGAVLSDIAAGAKRPNPMLVEYHAAGAATGAFMIRHGTYKYVHYVGMPPQLFDLAADPQEAHDLAGALSSCAVIAECERELRRVVDPEAADALARADQAAKIAAFGGREAVLAHGSLGFSPPPGIKPIYDSVSGPST